MPRGWKPGACLVGLLFALASAAYAGGPPSAFPVSSPQSGHATEKGRTPASDGIITSSHVKDEVLVRFKHGVSHKAKALGHLLVGATVVEGFSTVPNLQRVRLPQGVSVKKAVKFYRKNADILYAEPNYLVEALTTPNDPLFSYLWGLENTGQNLGTPDADIDAPEAWGLTVGSQGVVVAVIDTGVDYTHGDLSANMSRNVADCNSNSVDDDGNGFIDDCYGIDTVNNDSDPMDDHNHGTHVAGTIGAIGDNAIGVVGVNWNVGIMACKFLNSAAYGSIAGAIACLEYVKIMKDRGVNIVATNNSWGGGEFSQALFDAIDAHRQQGILFIAAAGNAASDNNTALFYPASYSLPNVISVAATTRTDGLASFSNYGSRTVHLGAPGHQILSTTIGNTFSTFSGTSMATPHVTGVAALLKAQTPWRDWMAIKNLILAGGDSIASLPNTITHKRLNAYGALTCVNSTVLSRLRPGGNVITGAVVTPINLAALHIKCADPNGDVTVTASTGESVTLLDNGLGSDQVAGDGIYSGQWTPSAAGIYTLTFPDGDVVTVYVLFNYSYSPASFNWRTITGTSLNLSDDSSAQISSPFPIPFGGGSFGTIFVGSNGNLNFTGHFTSYNNQPIPTPAITTLVAPFWDDFYPVPGSLQNVFWGVIGNVPNRELVVEWRDVRPYSCNADSSATVKFQVVLFEGSSIILFNYADTGFGGGCAFADRGGSATVGVQVAQDLGTPFSFNTQSLNDNAALLWTLQQEAFTLTVTKAGSGTVTSIPVGIDCGTSCQATFVSGTTVILTATAASGSIFAGWSGDQDCADGVVTMTANKSCTATFNGLQSITVLAPNGGETWAIDGNQMIQWKSSGVSGDVRIELSRDGGVSWQTLYSSTANDGLQRWKVKGPATSQGRIRVRSVKTPTVSDMSDGNFTIQ